MNNPICKCDYPDVDAIRVGDTYYMLSTTMHFFPGGAILRSYDLMHWELVNYLYDVLEPTPAAALKDGKSIYGQGMWAPSLRYHDGIFYACFVANDTHKTYLFSTSDIEGKWEQREIKGFYHDPSLFFDDGHVYIIYGNTDIWITELTKDLSRPLEHGLHRILVTDTGNVRLGYEGAHVYKINGTYYLFFIHWPDTGHARRTQACFYGDSLTGDFVGGDVLDDDMGYHNQGVAQGGIVDTPEGDWYAILFQDSGAVGRIPVLVPVHFDGGSVILGDNGVVPKELSLPSLRPEHRYEPLYTSDFTDSSGAVKLQWQWNHMPDPTLYQVSSEHYRIQTGKLSTNVTQAVNTLTQRLMLPTSSAEVTLDASELKDGDFAGLCAFQSCYAWIGVTREKGQLYIVMMERNRDDIPQNMTDKDLLPGNETARVPLESSQVALRMDADFSDMKDEVWFSYRHPGDSSDAWKPFGKPHSLYFTLDHFCGCRVGLFLYSTLSTGGSCTFSQFSMEGSTEK